ncbi:MAG: 2-hydroxyacyl-CoA dehydratase [Clostridiales bacterium]|jgi:predicted CoA-substrate-specific enzyme activase|nr:2-hydroxyacyl-CoA dehydratase [Clostridiales bacterium]
MTGYGLGVDIGSTTIKIAVADRAGDIIFSKYQRHFSNIRETLLGMVKEARERLGGVSFKAMITGSGGLSLAKWAGLSFVQEVVAVSNCVARRAPETDVAIEIGGEDAKIIYFKGGIEQRMNGICAGGTGSFIDQMAALLRTDASGLDEMASKYSTIYPIAARCGVFAKSDIQPLINDGAAKPDLAMSVFQAVVSQTISGLACGKPIKGKVCFLGGPLHFLPSLRQRFIDVLKLADDEALTPENSHLFAAIGAAVSAGDEKDTDFDTLINNLTLNQTADFEINRLDPLFRGEQEYLSFKARHESRRVARGDIAVYEGDVFLGIDAGSTTTKIAVTGENGELLYSRYKSNEGSPLKVISESLTKVYDILPATAVIRNSCVTGYGEGLIKTALNVDIGEIETVAHYKAAAFFEPDVDFILDIGGQDMKCMRVKDGVIDSVLLNEACSAGCGSFIETFASSLDMPVSEFAKIALFAKNPVDLGSRCTVFMNSRVKQAQKEGAEVADISAGLSYSVIKNALQKVIKITDPTQMGGKLVVQGGTFHNDAVLRCFELISRREAVRPDIAGIMGAFGASRIARERMEPGRASSILSREELRELKTEGSLSRCKACSNSCLLTINKFSGGRVFLSGNRCEKGAGKSSENNADIPNLFDYKLKLLFDREPLPSEQARRGTVGIPRALNMFENYPLWFGFFTALGYRVELSPRSSRALYEAGIDSIPSESACYPAKLAHGHVMSLINSGVKFIFYPSVAYERKEIKDADNNYNCPIVTSYSENIKNNVEDIREKGIDYRNPFISLADKKSLAERMREVFPDIPKREIDLAVEEGWAEQDRFRAAMRAEGERALEHIKEKGMRGVILAGRPYHADPEINHGIPELIVSYGAAVLTEDSVAHIAKVERPLGVRDQWSYHSRLYACASVEEENVELVQLTSFGCGLDAVTSDEVKTLLDASSKIYTLLKIDEVNNLGSVKIRMRSLFAALDERAKKGAIKTSVKRLKRRGRVVFTKNMRKTHTLLMPQMAPLHFDLIREAMTANGYNVEVMPAMDKSSVDTGLVYVNNDACYPSLIVVGQVINALKSGKYDVDNVSVLMSQTGGGCRATNYVSFIRKALENAGFAHVPVVSVNAGGLEKNPGMKYTPSLLNALIQALVYGDLFMRTLYKTRPYEKEPGSANALYDKWNETCKRSLGKAGFSEFKRNVRGIIHDFDVLPLRNVKKPRVGVVGEILVKYHPTANNDIVALLENEGAEAVVPDLMDFLTYSLYNANYKERYFRFSKTGSVASNAIIAALNFYRKAMREALEKSARFEPPCDIKKLGEYAEPIVSLGNQTGEGWFLTAEMVELIRSGTQNIVCAQPFACLPNHVTGKGVIKELKRKYPLANIVAVDYDPGASEVNQLNRIKLMLSAAFRNMENERVSVSRVPAGVNVTVPVEA